MDIVNFGNSKKFLEKWYYFAHRLDLTVKVREALPKISHIIKASVYDNSGYVILWKDINLKLNIWFPGLKFTIFQSLIWYKAILLNF